MPAINAVTNGKQIKLIKIDRRIIAAVNSHPAELKNSHNIAKTSPLARQTSRGIKISTPVTRNVTAAQIRALVKKSANFCKTNNPFLEK